MANLTAQQIAQLAYNAGFRGAALNQAVAIALAESGGRTDAYNPEAAAGTKNGSGSRGLWQIYGTAHPEYNNSSAFDPQVNANAAFKVFMEAGKSFRPWSTYNSGVRANQDYAKNIRGAGNPHVPTATAVKTVATGVTGWQSLASLPVAPTPQAPQFQGAKSGSGASAKSGDEVNLPFGISFNKSDVAFVFFGSSFLLIGILFLMIAGNIAVAKTVANSGVAKAALSVAM